MSHNIYSFLMFFYFKGSIDFLEVFKIRRLERFINQVFISCKRCFDVSHKIFDHLSVKRVSFKFVGIFKLSQSLIVVSIVFHITDFFRIPTERFSRLVLKIFMNSSYLQPMFEIPLSVRVYNKIPVALFTPRSFLVPTVVFLPVRY